MRAQTVKVALLDPLESWPGTRESKSRGVSWRGLA